MTLFHGASIVTNGLQLLVDAANPRSYSGSGSTWTDLSGNAKHVTLVNTPVYNSLGAASYFQFNNGVSNQTATTAVKIWAIGAGGGGSGTAANDLTSGGGGAGGVSYKLWS